MTYDLLIGDRSYSSWSLRGWLLFAAFDIPVRAHLAQMYDSGFRPTLQSWWPHAQTVPIARAPDGALWTDSLAIAEGLAERHPEAGHWPADPKARALARSLTAEMHSGFTALRNACPMNLRTAWADFEPADAVLADLTRLDQLWSLARDHATEGPWLFGAYSAADAFFAPITMRIAGYGLPVSPLSQTYVKTHLAHSPLRQWRDDGEAADRTLSEYHQGLPQRPFPL